MELLTVCGGSIFANSAFYAAFHQGLYMFVMVKTIFRQKNSIFLINNYNVIPLDAYH